jgi:hypothetical protein
MFLNKAPLSSPRWGSFSIRNFWQGTTVDPLPDRTQNKKISISAVQGSVRIHQAREVKKQASAER